MKAYYLFFILLFGLVSCNKNTKLLESLSNSVFLYEDGDVLTFNTINKDDSICMVTYKTGRDREVYTFDIIYSINANPIFLNNSFRFEIIDENTLKQIILDDEDQPIYYLKRQTREDIEKSKENMRNNIAKYVYTYNSGMYASIYNNTDFTIDEIIYEYGNPDDDNRDDPISVAILHLSGRKYIDKTKYEHQDTLYFLPAYTSRTIGESIRIRIISVKCKALGIN
jgi:hypothetical protein